MPVTVLYITLATGVAVGASRLLWSRIRSPLVMAFVPIPWIYYVAFLSYVPFSDARTYLEWQVLTIFYSFFLAYHAAGLSDDGWSLSRGRIPSKGSERLIDFNLNLHFAVLILSLIVGALIGISLNDRGVTCL